MFWRFSCVWKLVTFNAIICHYQALNSVFKFKPLAVKIMLMDLHSSTWLFLLEQFLFHFCFQLDKTLIQTLNLSNWIQRPKGRGVGKLAKSKILLTGGREVWKCLTFADKVDFHLTFDDKDKFWLTFADYNNQLYQARAKRRRPQASRVKLGLLTN